MKQIDAIKCSIVLAMFSAVAGPMAAAGNLSIEGEYRESYFHDDPDKNSQVSGPFELALVDSFFGVRVLDVEDDYRRETCVISDLNKTYAVRTHERLSDNNRLTLGDIRDGPFPWWNAWYKAQLLYLTLLTANQPEKLFDGAVLRQEFVPEIVTKRASIIKATIRTEVLREKRETEIKFWATVPIPKEVKAKEPTATFVLASLKVSHDPEKRTPSSAHFAFYRHVGQAGGKFRHVLRTEIRVTMEGAKSREAGLVASYSGKGDETVYVNEHRSEFFSAGPRFAYAMPGNEPPPFRELNPKRYDDAVKRMQEIRRGTVLKESKRKMTIYALGAFSLVMAGVVFYPRQGG